MSGPRRIFEFDGFRADLGNHQLFRGQTPILLTPKAFDTLAVLLERHGQVVDKEELLNLVWPGTFVEEATLTQNIYTLRKVLAEAGGRGNYIETLPRRGYRFGVPVEEVPTEPATTKPMPVVVLPTTEEEETALPNAETASLSPLAPLASRRRPQYLFAVVGLVVGALLLAMLIVRRSGSPEPEAARPGIRSVAVLPFEPLTPAANEAGQSEDAVLGLGMADALITRLSNLRQLSVRPTSAVRRYTGANRNLGAIARELNVDAVLDGSFQRAQQRLRVSVQLIAGETSAPLWAASYDAVETSLFDLQDSISQRLTEELRLEFTRQEWARLSQHRTSSPAAYQSYLKGRFFWNRRTAESLERAIGFFQEAIGLDPSFAAAYAGLADCYVLQPFV
nr:winged helix-turn-helix domain-containing protein [Thermoanaerobaculia bacterium]